MTDTLERALEDTPSSIGETDAFFCNAVEAASRAAYAETGKDAILIREAAHHALTSALEYDAPLRSFDGRYYYGQGDICNIGIYPYVKFNGVAFSAIATLSSARVPTLAQTVTDKFTGFVSRYSASNDGKPHNPFALQLGHGEIDKIEVTASPLSAAIRICLTNELESCFLSSEFSTLDEGELDLALRIANLKGAHISVSPDTTGCRISDDLYHHLRTNTMSEVEYPTSMLYICAITDWSAMGLKGAITQENGKVKAGQCRII